jgi:hypothetical protein
LDIAPAFGVRRIPPLLLKNSRRRPNILQFKPPLPVRLGRTMIFPGIFGEYQKSAFFGPKFR